MSPLHTGMRKREQLSSIIEINSSKLNTTFDTEPMAQKENYVYEQQSLKTERFCSLTNICK